METHPAPPSLKVNHDGFKWSSALMSAPIAAAYLEVGIMWQYITSVLLLEYMCMYFNIYINSCNFHKFYIVNTQNIILIPTSESPLRLACLF